MLFNQQLILYTSNLFIFLTQAQPQQHIRRAKSIKSSSSQRSSSSQASSTKSSKESSSSSSDYGLNKIANNYNDMTAALSSFNNNSKNNNAVPEPQPAFASSSSTSSSVTYTSEQIPGSKSNKSGKSSSGKAEKGYQQQQQSPDAIIWVDPSSSTKSGKAHSTKSAKYTYGSAKSGKAYTSSGSKSSKNDHDPGYVIIPIDNTFIEEITSPPTSKPAPSPTTPNEDSSSFSILKSTVDEADYTCTGTPCSIDTWCRSRFGTCGPGRIYCSSFSTWTNSCPVKSEEPTSSPILSVSDEMSNFMAQLTLDYNDNDQGEEKEAWSSHYHGIDTRGSDNVLLLEDEVIGMEEHAFVLSLNEGTSNNASSRNKHAGAIAAGVLLIGVPIVILAMLGVYAKGKLFTSRSRQQAPNPFESVEDDELQIFEDDHNDSEFYTDREIS